MPWIALHPPLLSLEAVCATLAAPQKGQAVALMAAHRITAANREALQRGVQPSLKCATVLALVGDVLLGQADAARDAQVLQALAHAALAFTPRLQSVSGSTKNGAVEMDVSLPPQHRPVWLLPEAQALSGRGALPMIDGHTLHLLAGPERIEAGWWDEGDLGQAGLFTRDYSIAQAADGALIWLYRTRLPSEPAAHNAGWFLHGRFG